MPLADDIRAHHGLAATHELHADGWSRRQLARAVAVGEVVRVRQGWYCLPDIDELYQHAVRVGGRLTCISGCEAFGLAVTRKRAIHVAVAPHASRLRSRADRSQRLVDVARKDVVIHWSDTASRHSRFTRGVLECLVQMAMCQPVEAAIAAADSALRRRLITHREWLGAIGTLPHRLTRMLGMADGIPESITESLCRVRLTGLGLEPRMQVRIAGVGRVDMVIGQRLVIELDGRAYHSDPERFEADRRRDARLSALGYRVLRFSYNQVTQHWSEVRAAILAAVARGDHLA